MFRVCEEFCLCSATSGAEVIDTTRGDATVAVLLDMTRAAAEPSLIIKWGGLPASWRWRGRMYELAELHAQWEDQAGRTWYRVESEEGLTFLLGRDDRGWVAALWRAGLSTRKPGPVLPAAQV